MARSTRQRFGVTCTAASMRGARIGGLTSRCPLVIKARQGSTQARRSRFLALPENRLLACHRPERFGEPVGIDHGKARP